MAATRAGSDLGAAPEGTGKVEGAAPRPLGPRLAAWAFGLYVVAALPIVVFGLGEYHWFLGDDWDFLATRAGGSPRDLIRPHAEHWSTVPVLVYRAEWHLFGLQYRGYQATVMVFHLAAAVLLRLVMRRAGIGPWVATAAAGIFVLFSPGQQNLLWSFQIGMVGSLALGAVQLLGSGGHARRLTRRDGLALLAGLGAIACGGIGPVMVGVVGLATLLRRGWRVAMFHTAPLAVVYLAWFAAYRDQFPKTGGHIGPSVLLRWHRNALTGVFEGIGAGRPLGAVIGLLVVAGAVVLVSTHRPKELLRSYADPIAMAVGAVAFQSLTANARWQFDVAGGRASRYIHVTAFMVLPVVALCFDALARRWPRALPVLVVILILPIVGNGRAFDSDEPPFNERYFDRSQETVEAIAWSPEAREVPRASAPVRDILGGEGPSVGWLLDAQRAGQVPDPRPVPAAIQDEVHLRLGLRQSFRSGPNARDGRTCRTYSEPSELDPREGDSFTLVSDMGVRLRDAKAPSLLAARYLHLAGSELTVELDDMHLTFAPLAPATTFRLCS